MAEVTHPTRISTRSVSREKAAAIIREVLRASSIASLKSSGSCMSPSLIQGSTVLVTRPELKPPRVGDIVLFEHPAGLRLHRLFWGPPFTSSRSNWRTRSDCGLSSDPPMPSDRILGTVVDAVTLHGQTPRLSGWRLITFLMTGICRQFRFWILFRLYERG